MWMDQEVFGSPREQDRVEYLEQLCMSLGDKIAVLQSQIHRLERRVEEESA